MYADHLAGAKSAVEKFESPQAVFEKCVDSMSDYLDSKKVSNFIFWKYRYVQTFNEDLKLRRTSTIWLFNQNKNLIIKN